MAVLSLVLTPLLAACAGDEGGRTSPNPSSVPRPSTPARLTIDRPMNGAVVRGTAVDLRLDLEGARIVPLTTTEIAPDEGHIHVLLDDEIISMTEGLRQSIPDVDPGPHRLTVEFVAADHRPFDPRVVAVVAFVVQA